MGYTGKGVTVLVLDDGIETNHTDLKKNYVCSISSIQFKFEIIQLN